MMSDGGSEDIRFLSTDGVATESETESDWFETTPPATSPRPFSRQLYDRLTSWRNKEKGGAGRRISEVGGAGREGGYKVYKWRWFMLGTLTLLNISNGMMWLTFAPIPSYTALFYGVSLDQVDWFSISYFVVSLLMGFVAIATLAVFGLRTSLYVGAGFNLVGSLLRWLSVAEGIWCSPHYRLSGYLVAMLGQVLTACAQPFLLYAPTKLANFWFSPKERAFCTMLASLGNPIGLSLAQLVAPNIVTSLDKFYILHIICTIPALIGAILALLAFWRSAPLIPPAPSSQRDPLPFFKGLKQTLTAPSFLLLLGIWGCSSGIFNALLTLLAQILCPYGYSDRDSGLWGALMIFSGLVGATGAGLILDYFKLFKEVAVVFLSLGMLSFVWFLEVFSTSGEPILVAFSVAVFGFFAFPLVPACMELGVEITYPVSEATSSGLLWSATQVMGIVLVLVGQSVQFPLPGGTGSRSVCGVQDGGGGGGGSNSSNLLQCTLYNSTHTGMEGSGDPQDLTYALLIYTSVGVMALLVLVFLFRPRYKRLEMEARAEALTRLQTEVVTPASSVTSLPATNRRNLETGADSRLTSTAM